VGGVNCHPVPDRLSGEIVRAEVPLVGAGTSGPTEIPPTYQEQRTEAGRQDPAGSTGRNDRNFR
jgi:hypothetical protein